MVEDDTLIIIGLAVLTVAVIFVCIMCNSKSSSIQQN